MRVSAVLLGLSAFAEALLANMPRSVIDTAYGILQETAAGNPPTIGA